jgi:C-terminal processing protease CtpA/Prc
MRLTAFVILFFSCLVVKAQVKFNGSFEELDSKHQPIGWDLTFGGQNHYEAKLDSVIKREGKYSVSLTKGNGSGSYGAINFPINTRLHGKTLMLIAAIKTENITNGWAGLWLRVDGEDQHILSFENMEKEGIKGTNDWKEYMVQVPYDEGEAVTINAGALLAGNGKIWLDKVRFYLDEVPIDKAPLAIAAKYRAISDTAFSKSSGIKSIAATPQNMDHLVLLGELWGFLKYHHPAIAKGDYNWDAELFRIMPGVINCRTDQQLSATLEKWVDGLGKPDKCTNCQLISSIKDIACLPNYGSLFNNKVFAPALTAKLKYILANSNNTDNYYVTMGSNRGTIPAMEHERSNENIASPDAGYRLLGLFRYWNMIQYFSPNRNIIPGGWNNKLAVFIPQFIKADTKLAYVKTMVKLVSATHDTHAFLISSVYEENLGKYRLPVNAQFIENKLVVCGYYKDTLNVKKNFKPGDIITSINGITVDKLVQQYMPYSSASNKGAALRDMPGTYLLRGKDSLFKMSLTRDNKPLRVTQRATGLNGIDFYKFDWRGDSAKPAYYLINKNIGYLFPGRYKDEDYDDLKKLFANTKGIIVDLRCYPTADLIEHFGNFIRPDSATFVKFTHTFINHPGLFVYSPGSLVGSRTKDYYKGKVVVIVNAKTQSNSEFVTMAFQTAPNVTVIGSTTAGADGNIVGLPLPWFYTYESGIGVYYPDGTNAQGAGVKINYIVRPTIAGVKAGRDELLEKAKQMILK